jgi:hypothetical protein
MYMSTNPVQHQRMKHVDIDLPFVRDRVALGEAKVLHVSTSSQFVDIFTKGLPTKIFQEFCTSLNIVPSIVPTAIAPCACAFFSAHDPLDRYM